MKLINSGLYNDQITVVGPKYIETFNYNENEKYFEPKPITLDFLADLE